MSDLAPEPPVAAAQPLDLAWGDDHHPQHGVEQRLDQGAVAPLDGHTVDVEPGQSIDQPRERLAGVRDLEPGPDAAGLVDHAHQVRLARPIDPGEQRFALHQCRPSCQDGSTVGLGKPARMLIAWRSNPRIPSGLSAK